MLETKTQQVIAGGLIAVVVTLGAVGAGILYLGHLIGEGASINSILFEPFLPKKENAPQPQNYVPLPSYTPAQRYITIK